MEDEVSWKTLGGVAAVAPRTMGGKTCFQVICVADVEGVVPAAEDVDVEHAASVSGVLRNANNLLALRDAIAPQSFENLRMSGGDVVGGLA